MAAKPKKVIIAPLSWGLGHATRCIPVVRHLLQMKCTVWAVLTPPQQALYEQAFGNRIQYIPLDEPVVDYNQKFPLAMARQLPKFSAQMRRETSLAEWLTKKIQPDLIISDNRYGFRSTEVPSVIISHQLQLRAGLLSATVNGFIHTFLQRFDAVWVPDVEKEPSLSGALSHSKKPKQTILYPGPLSRLKATTRHQEKKFDWVALISGPEPQRTAFEALITSAAEKSEQKIAIVAGLPEDGTKSQMIGNVTRYPHLNDEALIKLIAESHGIICRSGYSTLSDLAALQRKAVLVPTPGQTEQLYLASHFSNSFGFRVVKQGQEKKLLEALQKPDTEKFEFELADHWRATLKAAIDD